ncbi:MAG: hypothetical protein ACREJQ_06560 [bacterium]
MRLCQGASLFDPSVGGLKLDFPTGFTVDGEPFPIVLAQGARTVRIVAIDKAGNTAETTVNYSITNTWVATLLQQAQALSDAVQTDSSLSQNEKTALLAIINYYSVWYTNPGQRVVSDHVNAYLATKAAYLQAGWGWGLDDNEFLTWWGQYSPNRVLLPFLAARQLPNARTETSIWGKIGGWIHDQGRKIGDWLKGECKDDPSPSALNCDVAGCLDSPRCHGCQKCVMNTGLPGLAKKGLDAAREMPVPPNKPGWRDLGRWARDMRDFMGDACMLDKAKANCVTCACTGICVTQYCMPSQ